MDTFGGQISPKSAISLTNFFYKNLKSSFLRESAKIITKNKVAHGASYSRFLSENIDSFLDDTS